MALQTPALSEPGGTCCPLPRVLGGRLLWMHSTVMPLSCWVSKAMQHGNLACTQPEVGHCGFKIMSFHKAFWLYGAGCRACLLVWRLGARTRPREPLVPDCRTAVPAASARARGNAHALSQSPSSSCCQCSDAFCFFSALFFCRQPAT